MTRRALLGAFAATAVAAAPTYSNAAGFLRGGGDIRRIKMYSGRTGERIDERRLVFGAWWLECDRLLLLSSSSLFQDLGVELGGLVHRLRINCQGSPR